MPQNNENEKFRRGFLGPRGEQGLYRENEKIDVRGAASSAPAQDAPIRVAQVMGKMLGGGVETVVMNYYRHIDRSKVQFDFLVDADSTLVPREEIEDMGGGDL
ncbi:hypothetical protein [Paratractidigestivibacter sp.]|uniref:hypothetical protein n=1 Tax=Paratractidigestivibacter sp. TaxID=2847316 RepID=UPI002AC908B1|nr:hypothetical protein [Paratractidigestivibacter sp.]